MEQVIRGVLAGTPVVILWIGYYRKRFNPRKDAATA
jgi:hypothetical protein